MSFLRRCRVELSVDALDGVTREFLRAARRRLLYFPGSRAANKLGIAAPRWTSRAIGTGFLLHELLERFKEPGHARRFTLPAGGLDRGSPAVQDRITTPCRPEPALSGKAADAPASAARPLTRRLSRPG
jgi:hypothetical protein